MLDDPKCLPRCPSSHGDVVLGGSAGGERVHRRGVAQSLVLRNEGCSRTMCDHEARVQTTLSNQEGRQLAEGGVTEPFDSSFADSSKLMNSDGQIVQSLERVSQFS